MENFFSVPFVLVVAGLYGVTMKVADLLNEHGLRLFKHADILFGFLWGISGSFLVLVNPVVGSAVVAMNVAFIIRNRLDYTNHQIATSLIILTGFLSGNITVLPLVCFFLVFLLFGSIKDYADDVWHLRGFMSKLTEWMLYYPVPTFIYCFFFGGWVLFWIFTIYTLGYNTTKMIARNYGYK